MEKSARGILKLSPNEEKIYALRDLIKQASDRAARSSLIAAIILDELNGRDIGDFFHDCLPKIGMINENQSYGIAQIKPKVIYNLVRYNYLKTPLGWSHVEQKRKITISWILDEQTVPRLVAAIVNQIVDFWWFPECRPSDGSAVAQGLPKDIRVNISNQPDVIATLYSIGLYNRHKGVHLYPCANARGEQIANSMSKVEWLLNDYRPGTLVEKALQSVNSDRG